VERELHTFGLIGVTRLIDCAIVGVFLPDVADFYQYAI
jgi:hypothetical protein